MSKLNIGDKVIKNDETWVKNHFDTWGRGVGVGIVVEPPFELNDDDIVISWGGEKCFDYISQLKKID
jgi:thioredoxin reductase